MNALADLRQYMRGRIETLRGEIKTLRNEQAPILGVGSWFESDDYARHAQYDAKINFRYERIEELTSCLEELNRFAIHPFVSSNSS